MERHRAAVAKIAASVAQFFERREPFRISHGSTNSTRPGAAGRHRRGVVDIGALRHVLSVDAARRTALVEPNVPMDRLVESTLAHRLVPAVVMEFPGITAGGGFAGTAGESSSFRHGFFDDTVASVEMVLADGRVVTASREGPNAELFRGAAGAVGTLGVTTLLEVRLVEARTFVRTTYRRTRGVAEAVRVVAEEAARPRNDYVDGILFDEDHGVVITGEMTDDKPADARPQTFSGAWDPWFYLHVRERTRDVPPSPPPAEGSGRGDAVVEYIPLAEYLFRYDRGGFWVGASAFRYFGLVPFARATRWLLDDFLHTRMMYRALHASGESARFVVQDLALPFATAERFVGYVARELAIWPLWLCPLRRPATPTFHPHTTVPAPADRADEAPGSAAADETEANREHTSVAVAQPPPPSPDDDLMLNIGVWGWGPRDRSAFVAANRALEAEVTRLGGMKWLYAHAYYGEDEFWALYGGRGWYDALRAQWRAGTLPSVWDKVRVDVESRKGVRDRIKRVWPFGGLWGIWKSIGSGDYWLHRRAGWKWKG